MTQTRAVVASLGSRHDNLPMNDNGLHDWVATTLVH